MAQKQKAKWIKTTVALYGKQVKLWYQTLDALWYPSAGQQLLRIVVVRDPSGRRRDDCFFSLDLTLSATQILEIFSGAGPWRFASATSSNFWASKIRRIGVAKATTRTAPLIFYIYDLVLLWQRRRDVGWRRSPPSTACGIRKRTRFLLKILRTLRHATWQERIFSDPALDADTRKILQPLWNGPKQWRKCAKL